MDAVRAYIGLGSNLGDPVGYLEAALDDLNTIPETRCARCSSFYRSTPLGDAEQDDYVNAVAALDTTLQAEVLLTHLQAIEARHGRVRGPERWGPRTLDLDILLYGAARMENAILTVPHPGIMDREFVLYPLFEIAPELEIPGIGPLQALVENCPRRGLERLQRLKRKTT